MKSNTKTNTMQATGVLAIAQVPIQEWNEIYEPDEALKAGTIFAELDKPFFGGEKHG